MMKKISILLWAVIMVMTGCSKEDLDELRARQDNLDERVSALEAWQTDVNNNIVSLQTIVAALGESDYVTGITQLPDGSGYIINFLHNGAVTIKNGEKGEAGKNGEDAVAPVIGTKQDADGVYYWTLDGEWLPGSTGGKLRVTGEKGDTGITPLVRINADTNMWEVSIDSGTSWTSTGTGATGAQGVKGDKGDQGDAIFKAGGIDNTNTCYVELTLADDTKIRLPRYLSFKIGKDAGNGTKYIKDAVTEFELSLPVGLKETDYVAIAAQVLSERTGADVQTRSSAMWSAKVTKPTFNAEGVCNDDAKVTLNAPDDVRENETVLLEVSLIRSDGGKTVAARAMIYKAPAVGDFYNKDGSVTSTIDPDNTIGIVAATGDVAKDDEKLKEKLGDTSTGNHGLVVALKDVKITWQMTMNGVRSWADNNLAFQNVVVLSTADKDELNKAVGYTNTLVCIQYNKANGMTQVLPVNAATDVRNYPAPPISSSGWFVPSAKELSTICSGEQTINFADNYGTSGLDIIDNQIDKLITAGVSATKFVRSGVYHTSTETNYSGFETINLTNGRVYSTSKVNWSAYVRPIFAY